MMLTLEQGTVLVSIARRSVDTFVKEGKAARLETGSENDGFLRARRGAFVTLSTVSGDLRGCIGFPMPTKPLGEAVMEAAVGAAARDPRFPPVAPRELDGLLVEVSALTEPEPLRCKPVELPSHVRIGTDGLIVTSLGSGGLLLPQVATEMNLTPEDFLSHTCLKAGLLPDAWLTDKVQVQRFQAEVFAETTPRGTARAHETRA